MKTVSNIEFGCKGIFRRFQKYRNTNSSTPGKHTHRAKYELNPTSKQLFGRTIVGASEAIRPEAPKIPKD
ncbi:hypothetical protein BCON_0016g00650 [Botryotinia convoluta]|uniref:Uncharacterized protein n=1 Tax=Botryotinia convoluta TaxID=54673 RepID=A0A4Z1ITW7_9HELO|nr:hypothetical protein BCON_0016g00650 [Botryotinia convoluta]